MGKSTVIWTNSPVSKWRFYGSTHRAAAAHTLFSQCATTSSSHFWWSVTCTLHKLRLPLHYEAVHGTGQGPRRTAYLVTAERSQLDTHLGQLIVLDG